MEGADFVTQASFENRFWLQIMGDHARFMLGMLAASETQSIYCAQHYVNVFDA